MATTWRQAWPATRLRRPEAWLAGNTTLLGIDGSAVADLELLASAPIGKGRAVLFRQRFGGLPAGHDGLVVVGVVAGKVAYVSSSLAGGDLAGAASLSPTEAFRRAAASAGRSVGAVTRLGEADGWTVLRADGFASPQRIRLVALPIPGAGAVPAYEAIVLDGAAAEPLGVSVFVDARSGAVLLQESLVDDEGEPSWKVFPSSPSLDYSSADTRQLWCWTPAAGCDRVLEGSSPGPEWDVNSGTGSSFTTDGNNAKGVHNWFSNNPFTVGTETATARPDRDYVYGWTNQWFQQRCNPDTTFTSAERNDIDAARANLFAGHNRMHDWSYHLGFTEETFNLQKDNFGLGGLGNDHEQGNAQAGGVSGGPASGFAARDNANQITPPDGQAPITNMYLWQPIAGAFYAPCVDGDFDMSVIGHEYTHAISNRMVAGPNTGLSGSHGGAMGESWSDLAAMELLNEYGFVPVADENRFAVGPYVTGDKRAGIRNYGMNASPLNFSNVGYDFVCNQATCPLLTQVHADGEIWSATNFAIRQALTARYGAGTPALQAQCADGLVRPRCLPGEPSLDPARLRRVPPAAGGSPHDAGRPRRDGGGRPDPVRRREPGPAVEHVRQPRLRAERCERRAERRRSCAELRVADRDRGDAALRAGQRRRRGRRRAAVRRSLRGSDDAGCGHRSGDVARRQPRAGRWHLRVARAGARLWDEARSRSS